MMRTMRLISTLFVLVAFAASSTAQTAPAGNAHPESQDVSAASVHASVFGQVRLDQPVTVEQKSDFAKSLDLRPLEDLAVLHNGRVKIMHTLARETVHIVTGSRAYFDLIPGPTNKSIKFKYAPLFTLLDTIIDPVYYIDRPLIHVDYLPLRQSYLDFAFKSDDPKRELWLKLTRVSPRVVDHFSTPIFEAHGGDPTYRRGLDRVERATRLFLGSEQNLLLVAPEISDARWQHLADLPPAHPARQAALALGQAWRARDADSANAAIVDLAAVLPTINPAVYPTERRSLELTYNKSNAFELGYWTYLVSFLMLILAFGTGRKWLIAGGIATLVLAIGLHGFGFITRCLIAERFAIQNQFESMTGVSLFAALVGLAVMLARRQWLFGAAAAGTGFLVLIMATQTGIPGANIEREAAILNTSVLLKYHVTTVLTSYGLITLGFITSLFYLGTHYATKLFGERADLVAVASTAVLAPGTGTDVNTGPQRTLRDLDRATMTVLQLAFWTLGVGILLGAWWADHSWGRWWAFDPKETWALVTWIVYLIVIHVRQAGIRNRGLVTAWLSVVGFVVMLWTYFGVNLLLPGLHAYA